jgi:hypothetical protein
MQTVKALAFSIAAATMIATLPPRALVAPLGGASGARALDYLGASAPAPEPRDSLLLVMSLAAIALASRRSK